MPYGLRDIPRGEFGGDFAIAPADVGQGGLRPDNIGLRAANVTGSSIPAGSLVYLNGWDTSVQASGMPSVALASASNVGTRAQWVTLAAIANNAIGLLGQHFALTAQNTNAATVGDPVYLNTTAGGYALTTSPAGAIISQIVGRVAVKSATVGVVEFNLLSGTVPNLLQRLHTSLPTIGTGAGAYTGYIVVPVPGTIVGGRAVFTTSLAVNGTNYVTLTIQNLSNASVQMLAASPANSTFTGGTAITGDAAYPLTLIGTGANLIVAGGDILKVVATVTGTLGGAITGNNVATLVLLPS